MIKKALSVTKHWRVHPLSSFLSPSNIKGDFHDHCVDDTLLPGVSISLCIVPFGKRGRNVFCGVCLFFFDTVGGGGGGGVPLH